MPGSDLISFDDYSKLIKSQFRNTDLRKSRRKNKKGRSTKSKKNKKALYKYDKKLIPGQYYYIENKKKKVVFKGKFNHIEELETNPVKIMVYFDNVERVVSKVKIVPSEFNKKEYKFIKIRNNKRK